MEQHGLKINDLCLESGWNVEKLKEVVGAELAGEIMQNCVSFTPGQDVLTWKPQKQGFFSSFFSSNSGWDVDVLRIRASEVSWTKWVWHQFLPKQVSVAMWEALNRSLC